MRKMSSLRLSSGTGTYFFDIVSAQVENEVRDVSEANLFKLLINVTLLLVRSETLIFFWKNL